MSLWLTNRLINFIMSWWPFDKKENTKNNLEKKSEWAVFEAKTDYVSKVAGFLESGVREMKKDIKKL